MRIELYQQKHFKSCIKIIQSNTSKYISPSEQFDYINFLLRISKRYFVFLKQTIYLLLEVMVLIKQKEKQYYRGV